jgi:hypothetical protein
MRIALVIALIVLPLPTALWDRRRRRPVPDISTGGCPTRTWCADKQSFDVRFGIRRIEATFTVAANGFGWHQTFTNVKETFNSWDAVGAWCFAPGTLLFSTQQERGPRLGVYELRPEDLATIVDGYFKRYAPQAEWSGPDWECTPTGLSGPNPTNLSKVRELLEPASSAQ